MNQSYLIQIHPDFWNWCRDLVIGISKEWTGSELNHKKKQLRSFVVLSVRITQE